MSPRDHSYFQDMLEHQISGAALAPQDRLALFDHIETCDDCRQILEAEERITARMKMVPRLVAPSDLRSRILSQAVRDHRERTTTPSEDPTVADILSPKSRTSAASVAGLGSLATQNDDLPVFAGVVVPRPGRVRKVWRRGSPVLATGFLVVAGVGALYTGQFQGIPMADQAQQLVWSAVDSALGKPDPYQLPGKLPVMPPPVLAARTPVMTAGFQAPAGPLPGTQAVTEIITNARVWMASADSTVAALARATEEAIPGPAENAQPQIAALVLKPTDSPNTPGGFRESALAAAVKAMGETQPGGRVARQDQFAMGGQRYRLYTLELPTGSMRRMTQTLTPYQAPSDGVIVNALATQKQVNVSRNQSIQFYAGNEDRLRSALAAITPVSTNGGNESVRIIVVE